MEADDERDSFLSNNPRSRSGSGVNIFSSSITMGAGTGGGSGSSRIAVGFEDNNSATTSGIGFPWWAYRSVKVVVVKDKKIALLHHCLTLGIFLVLLLFLVRGKRYQAKDKFLANVSTKVKGHVISHRHHIVLDSNDVVFPAIEAGGLFVTTSMVLTNQSLGLCAGNDKNEEACKHDRDCPKGHSTNNGVFSGRCMQDIGFCELRTYCPLENDDDIQILDGAENLSIFIRVDGFFPNLSPDRKFSNYNSEEGTVLNKNLFILGDLVQEAMGDKQSYTQGAVILLNFVMDCNLDYTVEPCHPRIDVGRLDKTGFNFRMTERYSSTNHESRILVKRYGFRFLINVGGTGGKFHAPTLALSIGAGIAYISVASFLTDFAISYLSTKMNFYKAKYEVVV